ncbi:type II toxin-antitoxin system RelE family toxin [Streptomyces sp. P9-2]|uniref:type II toxin-antitoxin system RelE family toxin n=1 Tax=Streptomyces sp. P9-2 TaxID=3423201 RepID=UPI0019C7456E|nr:hypothetical protein GCM10018771_39590 [Streptomyces cellulosae]
MSAAKFGFAAHPEALSDLRALPAHVRNLALVELQDLVHGSDDWLPLEGSLRGFRKVYVDPEVQYRLVVQVREAPVPSAHAREIYLVAAGLRRGYAVYRAAQRRMGLEPAEGPVPDVLEATHARSPRAASTMTGRSSSTTGQVRSSISEQSVPPVTSALGKRSSASLRR